MSVYNTKIVAKNTMMLYIRMLLNLAISLYTSRIVLNVLGIEDYGIYNVVGGFVLMLGVLNNAMSNATQRYLSFYLVESRRSKLSSVFLMSVNIHFIIGVFVFLVAEVVGIYFLNNVMTFPPDRISSATVVFHLSVAAFFTNVVTVPYTALIIAHERMSVFALGSIVESTLKLLSVFLLQIIGFDKLIVYALLILLVTVIVKAAYFIYCIQLYKESRVKWFWDASLFKELFAYAGWNLWGNVAGVLSNHGVNVILNVFFGPAVNAARGIAFEIRAAINALVYNFQLAMNPQIIKTYASNERDSMFKLIFQGSKLSFFLLFFFSLPLYLECHYVISLWLKTVPDYSVVFTRLILINLLVDCVSGPLMTAAQATGKIRMYQLLVGGSLLFILPVSYFLLTLGYTPQSTFVVSIVFSFVALLHRLLMLRKLLGLGIIMFLSKVLLPLLLFALLSLVAPVIFVCTMSDGILRFLVVIAASILNSIIAFYYICLRKEERNTIRNFIINKISTLR
jgi:O-antigen/teichoic acid export membrane protein